MQAMRSLLAIWFICWAHLAFGQEPQTVPVFSSDGKQVSIQGVSFSITQIDEGTLTFLRQQVALQADLLNNAGVTAFQGKDYETALTLFQEALDKRPGFIQALKNQAAVYIALKKLDHAQLVYATLLKEEPNNPWLWGQHATLCLMQGNQQGAVNAYKQVAQLSSSPEQAYIGMARSYIAIGEYQKAIEASQEALKANPNAHKAYYEQGNAQFALTAYREAVNAYDAALKLHPTSFEVLTQRGRAKYALNEYKNAIADFDKAIELKEDYIPAYNNRAATYTQLRQYGPAMGDCEKVLQLDENEPLGWLNRGLVKIALRDMAGACLDLKRAKFKGATQAEALIEKNCGQ